MQPDAQLPNDTKKPFHSSGYAQVASGNRIGATSNISFNQRQVIESSRRIINGYKDSTLGSIRNSLKAKSLDDQAMKRGDVPPKPTLQEFNSANKLANSKPQNYNPFK